MHRTHCWDRTTLPSAGQGASLNRHVFRVALHPLILAPFPFVTFALFANFVVQLLVSDYSFAGRIQRIKAVSKGGMRSRTARVRRSSAMASGGKAAAGDSGRRQVTCTAPTGQSAGRRIVVVQAGAEWSVSVAASMSQLLRSRVSTGPIASEPVLRFTPTVAGASVVTRGTKPENASRSHMRAAAAASPPMSAHPNQRWRSAYTRATKAPRVRCRPREVGRPGFHSR